MPLCGPHPALSRRTLCSPSLATSPTPLNAHRCLPVFLHPCPPPPPGPPLQVKEVKLDPEGARSSEDDTQRVRAEAEARRSALEQWCITSYGEAFSSWIHVCAVRLFVESILRYGLPPQVRLKGGA